MNLLSENVIPGNKGKVFGTNAKQEVELEMIKNKIMELKEIRDVTFNLNSFPRELTIYSSKLVKVEDIAKKVKSTGFHIIPKESLNI